MFKRNRPKPFEPLPFEEIRKRATLLVIDDSEFGYQELFERDQYHIQRWPEVQTLSQLTDSNFDLILLDLHGVGLREDPQLQGLGILRSIKDRNPTQLVVAYTSHEWGARAQEFFALADAVLEKDDPYVTFKRAVDDLLSRRYTPGYFIGRINQVLGDQAILVPEAVAQATKAIQRRTTTAIRSYLGSRITDQLTVDRVIAIIGIAISILTVAH